MDEQARADLLDWLAQQGFTGSSECLNKKLGKLHLETRSRLAWMIWEPRFSANAKIVSFLRSVQALGEKHFEHVLVDADYLQFGRMDFSTPKPQYAHRAIKAISVQLGWAGRDEKAVEVRLIFRYSTDDGIRDRYVVLDL